MKGLWLIYDDEEKSGAMSPSEPGVLMEAYLAFTKDIRKHRRGALRPARTARAVRIRTGKVSTTDGPFAETKEHRGGSYLIEAQDLNAAVEAASSIPPARLGNG